MYSVQPKQVSFLSTYFEKATISTRPVSKSLKIIESLALSGYIPCHTVILVSEKIRPTGRLTKLLIKRGLYDRVYVGVSHYERIFFVKIWAGFQSFRWLEADDVFALFDRLTSDEQWNVARGAVRSRFCYIKTAKNQLFFLAGRKISRKYLFSDAV